MKCGVIEMVEKIIKALVALKEIESIVYYIPQNKRDRFAKCIRTIENGLTVSNYAEIFLNCVSESDKEILKEFLKGDKNDN